MRDIQGLGRVGPAAPARRARGAAGAFRLPDGTAEAAATGAAGPLTPVGVLAVQEADDPGSRDRRGAARAAAMLADLNALQVELLDGRPDPACLERLARLTEGERPSDPALADALDAIALRAKVELARRGLTVRVSPVSSSVLPVSSG
ncbi:flagellar assembly protein FliX [Muricoccus radiodurans]|uniref:flagellar assembly protein FliX n=1 Tax=Muricoccus radiodurans TaxID=2231721 RepID=UPI003CE93583